MTGKFLENIFKYFLYFNEIILNFVALYQYQQ
jgi:hypothetical protein